MREHVLVDGGRGVTSHREPLNAGGRPTQEEWCGTTAQMGRATGCCWLGLGRGVLAWGYVLLSRRAGSGGLSKESLASRAVREVVDGGEDFLRRGLLGVGLRG